MILTSKYRTCNRNLVKKVFLIIKKVQSIEKKEIIVAVLDPNYKNFILLISILVLTLILK